jgi:sigma-54 dependent transcriptional regulator, acetoin dehydrogenase operon transcriptional activator AcoR
VRELQNWIQFALVKCKGAVILPEHLPNRIILQGDHAAMIRKREQGKLTVEAVREALRESNGNRVDAARRLGVGRATLYRFLSAHPE